MMMNDESEGFRDNLGNWESRLNDDSMGRTRIKGDQGLYAMDADLTLYWPEVRGCWEDRGSDGEREG